MGLDMYAYSGLPGQREEYWNHWDSATPNPIAKPKELAYWRKHPNLHGWMERLWIERNPDLALDGNNMFNGVELELTEDDLNRLEEAVQNGSLPPTTGFFFGDGADEYYKEQDLEFIAHARADIFCGFRVFYNSSW